MKGERIFKEYMNFIENQNNKKQLENFDKKMKFRDFF